MNKIIYLFFTVVMLTSCEKKSNENIEEITKEQASKILQKHGFEYEFNNEVGESGQLNFKTIEEFETHIKAMANQRNEYLKKHPVKDRHAILQALSTDRAKIDSMSKWVREGNFHISVAKKGNLKSGGSSYNISADSVEFYYWKMKEKENQVQN
jgi:hypothetical protein